MFKYFATLFKKYKPKHHIVYYIFILFTVVTGVLSLTMGLKGSTTQMFEIVGYGLIGALSLSLVVGFLGELSLGHAGFMSIGAMFGALVQQKINIFDVSPILSLFIGILVGGSVAAIFGLIIGIPTLRLKGDYLAIVTLAFGEIIAILFENNSTFGGALGLKNSRYRVPTEYLFIIIFVVFMISLALVRNILKSKHGRAIMAIRDNEIAAKSMGINVSYYKIFVFTLSAFLAGVAGALFAASSNVITSSTFNYNYSINNMLVMVVLGGMGNINGTIVASIIISFLNIKLPVWFQGAEVALVKNMFFALILILLVIYNNAPSFKKFREKYNVKNAINWIKAKVLKLFHKEVVVDEGEQKDYPADWSVVPTKIKMDAIVSTDFMIEQEGPDKPDKGGNN